MQQPIKIQVTMDAKTFRDFVWFDNFKYRKIWKRPLQFALIFAFFSALCFLMRGTREQADLLGTVLLVIGLGLPLVYFGMFFRTLSKQIERLKLEKSRPFYTILLSDAPQGIVMTAKGAADRSFAWSGAERAYRTADAVYFYVAPGQAIILPFRDLKTSPDALWRYLSAHIGEDRLTTL